MEEDNSKNDGVIRDQPTRRNSSNAVSTTDRHQEAAAIAVANSVYNSFNSIIGESELRARNLTSRAREQDILIGQFRKSNEDIKSAISAQEQKQKEDLENLKRAKKKKDEEGICPHCAIS